MRASLKFYFFVSIWVFLFMNIHESQDCSGRGRAFSLTPHYHFHPLHWHLDISRAITAKSSPLHIASSWTRTGTFAFRAQVTNHQTTRLSEDFKKMTGFKNLFIYLSRKVYPFIAIMFLLSCCSILWWLLQLKGEFLVNVSSK